MTAQTVPALPPIGCCYAAQQAWNERNLNAHKINAHTYVQDPYAGEECYFRFFDVSGTAFTRIAFNNAGSLLAASTTTGIVRFIGLKTRCVYASIDLNVDIKEVSDCSAASKNCLVPNSSPPEVVCLEFIDYDRKLSVVYNNFLLIYDLLNSSSIQRIARVPLKLIADEVETRFHSSSGDLTQPRFQTPLNSQDSTPSLTLPHENGVSSVSKTTRTCSDTSAKNTILPSGFYVSYCQVLSCFQRTGTTQGMAIDFVVAFRQKVPSVILVPVRVMWCLQKQECYSIIPLLPFQCIESPHVGRSPKDRVIALTIFRVTPIIPWSFLVDGSLTQQTDNSSDRARNEHIQRHNCKVAESLSSLSVDMCSCSEAKTSNIKNAFCAIGTPAGKIFVVCLASACSSPCIVGDISMKSSHSAPRQLVVNRSGTLILSRSSERLTIISLSFQEVPSGDVQDSTRCLLCSHSETARVLPCFRASLRASLNILFYYQQAVQRERLEWAAFSYSPSLSEIVLLSGTTSSTLHFFSAPSPTASSTLLKSIDTSKCGVITQVCWNPGSFFWAGVAPTEGCILFFGPRRLKQKWFLTLPNFELLGGNREIIESETEFDLVEKQETSCSAPTGLTAFTPSHFQTWYTTAVCNTLFIPYPFCSPCRKVNSTHEVALDHDSKKSKQVVDVSQDLDMTYTELDTLAETALGTAKTEWLTVEPKVHCLYREILKNACEDSMKGKTAITPH